MSEQRQLVESMQKMNAMSVGSFVGHAAEHAAKAVCFVCNAFLISSCVLLNPYMHQLHCSCTAVPTL